MNEPVHQSYTSVKNMLWNDAYLSCSDRDYIRHVDDLITFEKNTGSDWLQETVSWSFLSLAGETIERVKFSLDHCGFQDQDSS